LELQFPAPLAEGAKFLKPDKLSTVSPEAFFKLFSLGLVGFWLPGERGFGREDPFPAHNPGLL
jgi:hypothetical protein